MDQADAESSESLSEYKMKLNCVYCGRVFRISAEQLGGQGRCPHCHEIIYLPKAESPGPLSTEAQPLGQSSSSHYLVAIGATVLLHLLLLIVLGFLSWGNQHAIFASGAVRVKIGRPTPRANPTQDQRQWQPSPAASVTDVPVESLQEALTQVDLSAFSQSQSASETQMESFQSNDLSALISGTEALEADLSEDFGALLNRLKKDGLDVVITFDSTGSMTGEIDQVKSRIRRIGKTLFELIPQTRISICTYRDQNDRYVVKGLPLSRNLDEIQQFLDDVTAGGGEDNPESVDEGLRWAIRENRFQASARKVVLLFGDAPPHDNRLQDCLDLAAEFHQQQGGIVSTVTCHSNQQLEAFQQIARLGGGESFLTRDEREIVSRLVVLVFGSQHQEKVLEAFRLLDR